MQIFKILFVMYFEVIKIFSPIYFLIRALNYLNLSFKIIKIL